MRCRRGAGWVRLHQADPDPAPATMLIPSMRPKLLVVARGRSRRCGAWPRAAGGSARRRRASCAWCIVLIASGACIATIRADASGHMGGATTRHLNLESPKGNASGGAAGNIAPTLKFASTTRNHRSKAPTARAGRAPRRGPVGRSGGGLCTMYGADDADGRWR